jgi:uncharacterized protein DUF4339
MQTMNIYVSRNGEEFGPYFIDDLRIDFASGSLSASDLARFEGASEWIPLDAFLRSPVHGAEKPDPGFPLNPSDRRQTFIQPTV